MYLPLLVPSELCLKLTTPLSLRDISPKFDNPSTAYAVPLPLHKGGKSGRYKAVEMKSSYLHSSNIRAKRYRGPRKVLRSKLFGERRNKCSKLKRFAREPFSLAKFVWTSGCPAIHSSFFIFHSSFCGH